MFSSEPEPDESLSLQHPWLTVLLAAAVLIATLLGLAKMSGYT